MKERKEGTEGLAPLAAGASGIAALLVGGCGGVSFWIGISSEYLGEIFFSGIPISLVLVLIFLFARTKFLKPQRMSKKEKVIYSMVFVGIPILGLFIKHTDLFLNQSDKNFIQLSGILFPILFVSSALVMVFALLFYIPVGVANSTKPSRMKTGDRDD